MKNSGVEWIGEIPEDWETIRNKRIMKKVKNICEHYNNENVLSLTMNGVIVRDLDNPNGKMPLTFDGYQYINENNLLMCLFDIDVTPRCVGIIKNNGVTSPAYSQFELTERADVNYFYYYYLYLDNKKELLHLSKNLRYSLTENQLGEILVPLPPKSTQQRIASYLDKKCSKIEETIQNQQQVIEKLKAYKQSLITEAVIGKIKIQNEIPDFKYCNLGFIAEFKNGLNYNASDFGTEVKFLGVGDFQNYLVLNDESMFSNIITDTEIEDDYYLKNGDIIFVRSNGSKEFVGRSIMVDNIDFKVTYSGFCIRLRNKEPKIINSKFLLYFFRSDYFRNELQRLSQGSNISNINQDLLSHIKIPLVDMRFQESVIDYLNKKCTAIDTAIEQKQNLIEKLTEYKKSLIYECVTGKKEV